MLMPMVEAVPLTLHARPSPLVDDEEPGFLPCLPLINTRFETPRPPLLRFPSPPSLPPPQRYRSSSRSRGDSCSAGQPQPCAMLSAELSRLRGLRNRQMGLEMSVGSEAGREVVLRVLALGRR
ncbi:hypothetical protein GUITHDRAFT_118423 [Guillardia theta CCMP2712]|uniref:Uncharacterized protein n=1 Tax=Guillardia theta (strain CCMP2712) TaxID=905079 RepID=L1IHX0_GUITC|nr:hypothetical protein GUITHDRAFT_118423 [Guillardia theta CCMP2712]EKX35405.1 hypothetical protein GUITHDRAFT_118423 [Guillardia theta CCMP2712]|eukprot:XP_005822385.1 hypothetical protein GUITHDRAFT_118423 [Guillardia theta CCMP2712]